MTPIYHHIKAILLLNPFKKKKQEFYARVLTERTLDVKAICQSAVVRGQAFTTADAMTNHVELFLKEMEYQLKNGYAVNTGTFTATPMIRGVFENADERFDRERHKVYFQFNQGVRLRKGLSEVEVEITGLGDSVSYIDQIRDVKTATVNQHLTPGHTLVIQGKKLKLMGEDPSVGVVFINQETNQRYPVEATDLASNLPGELICTVPALPPGFYQVEVATQYTGHALLKNPRIILSECVLTVTE